MADNICPICKHPATIGGVFREDKETGAVTQVQAFGITCDRCGKFETSMEFFMAQKSENLIIPTNEEYIISATIRNLSDQGRTVFLSVKEGTRFLKDSITIPQDPLEAIDKILIYCARTTSNSSQSIFISEDDYPVAVLRDKNELMRVLLMANDLGYIHSSRQNNGHSVQINIEGWKRLREIKRQQRDSSQAFVAMWFNDEFKKIYENGFEPALKITGYNPIIMSNLEYNDNINDRIIAEIKKSGLMIADFTGSRGGVYFEAGFALGLGIPVIWTCRRDYFSAENIHFDTNHYNFILWDDEDDLKTKLIDRIEATLPLKKIS